MRGVLQAGRSIALLLTLFMVTMTALGAENAPPRPRPGETIGEYEERMLDEALAAAHVEAAKTIAAKTTATNPPEGFAGRVNDALADFLPFFQGAINGVSTSEDQKSITLRFNPIAWKNGETAFAATLVEPMVFQPVLDAVVAPAREEQRQLLLGQVDDWGDLTLTATYGYLRRAETWESQRLHVLWGRDYAVYRPLVDSLLAFALNSMPPEIDAMRKSAVKAISAVRNKASAAVKRTPCERPSFDELVLDCLEEQILSPDDYQALVQGLARNAEARTALYRTVREWNLAGGLPELIDNQPQLTAKLSYATRDAFVGPDSYALSVSYELGFRNFNSVIRQYRWLKRNAQGPDAVTPFQAFRDVMSEGDALGENKIVFGMTYNRVRAYALSYAYAETVTDPGTGTQIQIPRNADVDLPSSSELTGKIQWGRFLGRPKAGEPVSRIDVAAEYLNVSDESERLDRFVVRVTYTHPVSTTVSFPVTLTYANHGDFLGEQDRVLGAHVGLSYKLNRREEAGHR